MIDDNFTHYKQRKYAPSSLVSVYSNDLFPSWCFCILLTTFDFLFLSFSEKMRSLQVQMNAICKYIEDYVVKVSGLKIFVPSGCNNESDPTHD